MKRWDVHQINGIALDATPMTMTRCEGWWEQIGYGRQPMHDLLLSFSNGDVTGSGHDIIGPFTFAGQINGDKALLVKHYLGGHRVDYPGQFDGEGTFQGLWSIHGFGGKWMIRVVNDEQTRDQADMAIKDWP
ncbi:MAG: hypothetical protein R3C05_24445 [Pirellulaceae bacterium]